MTRCYQCHMRMERRCHKRYERLPHGFNQELGRVVVYGQKPKK